MLGRELAGSSLYGLLGRVLLYRLQKGEPKNKLAEYNILKSVSHVFCQGRGAGKGLQELCFDIEFLNVTLKKKVSKPPSCAHC